MSSGNDNGNELRTLINELIAQNKARDEREARERDERRAEREARDAREHEQKTLILQLIARDCGEREARDERRAQKEIERADRLRREQALTATIENLVERLERLETVREREQPVNPGNIPGGIPEAIINNPKVRVIDRAAIADQQNLEARMIEIGALRSTFDKLLYYFDKQPTVVKLAIVVAGFAGCVGVAYVFIHTAPGRAALEFLQASPAAPISPGTGNL